MSFAPEKYQHVIMQAKAGTEGVVNFADDLICHGKIVLELDQRVHKLLAKLEENMYNLTLNGEKCKFRMNKIVSFLSMVLNLRRRK